jgi:hypothetical protein
MAYDRYDARRDWREGRARWRDDDRFDRGWNERDRNERGWFERAGDEIASWFGDDDAERRRRQDIPGRGWGDDRRRFSSHLRNEDDVRSYYSDRDRDLNRERDRAFMSDDDWDRYERRPRWRDEGYRRPYTGRFTGRQDWDRGERVAGRSGDFEGRMDRGGSYYGVGAHHDRHYDDLRQRHLDELDRDYEDYARENRSRFEDDFSSWRETRQQKRGLLGQVREHMEVVGSDGEHVGTVDCARGDRLILTKSDAESGGAHHSLMCTSIDRIEGDKVILDTPADEARRQWRDESRDRALFERPEQGEAGPHMLNRSFSGTY